MLYGVFIVLPTARLDLITVCIYASSALLRRRLQVASHDEAKAAIESAQASIPDLQAKLEEANKGAWVGLG